MTDWQERFKEFVAEWMRDYLNLPCKRVDLIDSGAEEWWDYSEQHGISFEMRVYWVDNDGSNKIDQFSGGIEEIFSFGGYGRY